MTIRQRQTYSPRPVGATSPSKPAIVLSCDANQFFRTLLFGSSVLHIL